MTRKRASWRSSALGANKFDVKSCGDFTQKSWNDSEQEPWQKYQQQKQLRQKQLRQNYLQLILFTLLFGVLTIGLRLDLRTKPEQRLTRQIGIWGWELWQQAQTYWTTEERADIQTSGGSPPAEIARSIEITASQGKEPTANQLEQLVGKKLLDEKLSGWGEGRKLVGSNDELELRYFPKVGVYLLRSPSDDRVVYAGKRSP